MEIRVFFIRILFKENQNLVNLLNNSIQKISVIFRTKTLISLNQKIFGQIAI